jgi:hypothetical protein
LPHYTDRDSLSITIGIVLEYVAPSGLSAPPPTSVLEAIARAKGMPVALRAQAARAAGLDEAEVEITEASDLECSEVTPITP